MNDAFDSTEEAMAALSDPDSPRWFEAFGYLSAHPDTAQAMQETFRETLAEMGVEPTGVDPATGEAVFSADDVAQAMGVPEDALKPRPD